jgi:hypothetical protein
MRKAGRARQCVECIPPDPLHYRYQLRIALGVGPTLTVVLKNPSLADARRSDPTAGKVEAWAHRNGFGGVTYLNLFAYRSPHPAVLNQLAYAEAIGPENDTILAAACAETEWLVAAWGNPNGIDPGRYAQRVAEVKALIRNVNPRPWHVVGGWTRAGQPRHGLQWNGDAQLLVWQPSCSCSCSSSICE